MSNFRFICVKSGLADIEANILSVILKANEGIERTSQEGSDRLLSFHDNYTQEQATQL